MLPFNLIYTHNSDFPFLRILYGWTVNIGDQVKVNNENLEVLFYRQEIHNYVFPKKSITVVPP